MTDDETGANGSANGTEGKPASGLSPGISAVDHSTELIRAGATGGVLILDEPAHFLGSVAQLVSQHYPWEGKTQEIERLAARHGCRVSAILHACGIARNERNPTTGQFEWDHTAEGAAEVEILYQTPAAAEPGFRVEKAPVELCVIEGAQAALASLFEAWLPLHGWEYPVVLLTGDPVWLQDPRTPGMLAVGNVQQAPDGKYVIVYVGSPGTELEFAL